jgi:hypothetical protein
MFKMASHESFGHLQPKLWAKEGPGVSLTPGHKKSAIDPIPTCVGGVQHGVGKLSKIATRLVQSSSRSKIRVRSCDGPKSRESKPGQFRDSFGTPLWESRDKEPLGRGRGGAMQRILYGGKWWLPPSLGRGESSESKVARGLSQHQKGAEWVITNLWLVLDARPCNKIIVPLPSLITGLLARLSYPFQCWKSGTAPKFQLSAIQHT